MITGWLFDVYCLEDRIILLVKTENKTYKIEKFWTPSFYVSSDNEEKIKKIEENSKIISDIKEIKHEQKIERASDKKLSNVLKITVKNSKKFIQLARRIQELEEYGVYRLYNVDIPPEQSYLYETDIYPLGQYKISKQWKEISNIKDTDYSLPTFTKISLQVNAKKTQKIPSKSDKIESIQINDITLQSDSEENMINDCVDIVNYIDPDFIITKKGDTWDLPYLVHRAEINKITDKIVLGREKSQPLIKPNRTGTSYFSYGQIHFKPYAVRLLGRIHIDESSCFIWKDWYSIHGIYEIARTCRLPLHTATRASIGKCMSSVQFYKATRRNLLIPWKPTVAEMFKSRMDLLCGDRGGLILEPRIGVHENVGEVDFASLFGNIMLKKNISAETINCTCCYDSKIKVPELGYRICNKQGIVPESLELLLEKRKMYTDLIEKTDNIKKQKIYKERKSALKWILVTSFGYLGFNNAKFGRIDAHMAVCAFARELLISAIRISENEGFEVLHGIVDSMWVYKKNATKEDYENLRNQIAEKTGFSLSLEIYNWIVFLPSKENKIVPVPNRYFGANQNGELKIRGIEIRRHDTPVFFSKCQQDILELFAKCKNKSEIKQKMEIARQIQEHYRKHLLQKEIPIKDLVFTNRITRGTDQHKSNTVQADAVNQLKWEGKTVEPGQKVKYIITDYARKISKRVVPLELASPKKYDAKRYSELLDECCRSIIEPFLD
jgi:DNA polymerase I